MRQLLTAPPQVFRGFSSKRQKTSERRSLIADRRLEHAAGKIIRRLTDRYRKSCLRSPCKTCSLSHLLGARLVERAGERVVQATRCCRTAPLPPPLPQAGEGRQARRRRRLSRARPASTSARRGCCCDAGCDRHAAWRRRSCGRHWRSAAQRRSRRTGRSG